MVLEGGSKALGEQKPAESVKTGLVGGGAQITAPRTQGKDMSY